MPTGEPVEGVPGCAYVCAKPGCGGREVRTPPPTGAGTVDDSARVAGWHLGYVRRPGGRVRVQYCPACMGHDPAYWARRAPESTGVHALPPGWSAER